MGNCMPHLFDCCIRCVNIFFTRDSSRTSINGACCDAQTIASENDEEVVKDDEDQKKSKEKRKKKRVKFAREMQR